MSSHLSRRDLLKASAAAAVGSVVAPSLASAAPVAQSGSGGSAPRFKDKVRIAMIGVSGRGSALIGQAAQLGEIVMVCDVDANFRAKAVTDHPKAMAFVDYRKMLDVAHKYCDAVIVATPDHSHAPASALALRAGKAVYTEKPLTRTVYEARKLRELARRAKVPTQMGNQGTAIDELRKFAAAMRAGTWGAVKEIHCWTNRSGGWWPQGVERPTSAPTPKHVAWDEWIGPSPFRQYAEGYHPFAWRGWWDFGCGSLGDIGCHCMNLPFMAFDLVDPIAVTAETSPNNKDSFPSWSIIKYEFAARGKRPATNLFWYDGGKLPSLDLLPGMDKVDANGCIIVMEKGTFYAPGEYGAYGRILGQEVDVDALPFEKSAGHMQEWINAIQGEGKAWSNYEYSAALTETVLIGNLGVWAGGLRVEWDAKRMVAKGHPEMDVLLRPQYREGWEL